MILRTVTNRITYHHSLTDDGGVESFRRYHMLVNGWEDIGYHFVTSQDGITSPGRNLKFIGAHASGKNFDSIGHCLIGNYHNYEPTISTIEACIINYKFLCEYYSKKLIVDFHRPCGFDNSCPGNKFNRLDFCEILYRSIL